MDTETNGKCTDCSIRVVSVLFFCFFRVPSTDEGDTDEHGNQRKKDGLLYPCRFPACTPSVSAGGRFLNCFFRVPSTDEGHHMAHWNSTLFFGSRIKAMQNVSRRDPFGGMMNVEYRCVGAQKTGTISWFRGNAIRWPVVGRKLETLSYLFPVFSCCFAALLRVVCSPALVPVLQSIPSAVEFARCAGAEAEPSETHCSCQE